MARGRHDAAALAGLVHGPHSASALVASPCAFAGSGVLLRAGLILVRMMVAANRGLKDILICGKADGPGMFYKATRPNSLRVERGRSLDLLPSPTDPDEPN